MQQFKGTKISLISKSDIRYEGILEEINAESSTIALSQVRSFGTEGRIGDPTREIAASPAVYIYICFRAGDVKDLHVVESAAPQHAPPQVPDDPAILGTAKPPQAHSFPHEPTAPSSMPSVSKPSSKPSSREPKTQEPKASGSTATTSKPESTPKPAPTVYSRNQNHSSPTTPSINSSPTQHPHHGHHHHHSGRGRGRGGRGNSAPVPKDDFDFEASNAKFSKDQLMKEFEKMKLKEDDKPSEEAEVIIPEGNTGKFYDKTSSFFDDISCEAKERAESGGEKSDRRNRNAQERHLNMETFGQSTVDHRFGNRGYRGRGRGRGRGGYRGRPRYNYYQNGYRNQNFNSYNQSHHYQHNSQGPKPASPTREQ